MVGYFILTKILVFYIFLFLPLLYRDHSSFYLKYRQLVDLHLLW
jgi:hypothetical protein